MNQNNQADIERSSHAITGVGCQRRLRMVTDCIHGFKIMSMWPLFSFLLTKGLLPDYIRLQSQGSQVEHEHLMVRGFPMQFLATSGLAEQARHEAGSIKFKGIQQTGDANIRTFICRFGSPLLFQGNVIIEVFQNFFPGIKLEAEILFYSGDIPKTSILLPAFVHQLHAAL